MAFQNPSATEQDTFAETVFLEGLAGVFGTTGVEAAGMRQKWRNKKLVAPQEPDEGANCQFHL